MSRAISLSLSIIIGVGSMIATAGVTWGIYSQRIEALEVRQEKQEPLVREHDRQLAAVSPQLEEIKRQLARIEQKLDSKP